MTGKARKFDEVRQILARGEGSIDVESRDLNCMPYSTYSQSRQSVDDLTLVPEIQGTTQEKSADVQRNS